MPPRQWLPRRGAGRSGSVERRWYPRQVFDTGPGAGLAAARQGVKDLRKVGKFWAVMRMSQNRQAGVPSGAVKANSGPLTARGEFRPCAQPLPAKVFGFRPVTINFEHRTTLNVDSCSQLTLTSRW